MAATLPYRPLWLPLQEVRTLRYRGDADAKGTSGWQRPATASAMGTSAAGHSFRLLGSVAAAGLSLSALHRGRRFQGRHSRRCRVYRRAIDTFLVPGPKIDVGKLAMAIAPLAAHIDISCLVFFSLGVKPEIISAVAGGSLGIHGMCPVYIADCYGIIGWDKKEGKNVEMMEEGRGSEYGCPGGQGGEGVVVVAFRGKHHGGETGGTHMVVKAHGKAELQPASTGVSYGGYAKACYKLEHSGDLVPIDEFVVSSSTGSAVVSYDGDDAGEVAAGAAKQLPSKASAAGYFPCFCRGYNKYMKDGVEPAAFASEGLDGVPIFGMFAHGELGPNKGVPITVAPGEAPETEHDVHSSTSILALYD